MIAYLPRYWCKLFRIVHQILERFQCLSAYKVAVGHPLDATIAPLCVDHRSHNNNQQQVSDWNQIHFETGCWSIWKVKKVRIKAFKTGSNNSVIEHRFISWFHQSCDGFNANCLRVVITVAVRTAWWQFVETGELFSFNIQHLNFCAAYWFLFRHDL